MFRVVLSYSYLTIIFSRKSLNSWIEMLPSLFTSTSSRNKSQSPCDIFWFPKHFSHSSFEIRPSPFFVKSGYQIE